MGKATADMRGPLAGIKVLDLTTVFMGPHATQILAEYGAEVIKLEAPEGDIVRWIGPARHEGMGGLFLLANRGKRSIVVDLKQGEGREIALKLAAQCDVLVYNLRPQVMARLGLGYETLKAVNPTIVYVGTFGFGQDGPYADKPAYDDLVQGAAGLASLPNRINGDEPRYVPCAIVDRTLAFAAVNAVLAALLQRARTGAGQAVDVPMFETMAHVLLGEHLYGQVFEPPAAGLGYPRSLSPDRKPYATKDGYLCAVVYNDKQWAAFFDLIGQPQLKHEERFRSVAERTRNIQAVHAFLAEVLATRTTAQWLQALALADIPAMPMHSLESLVEDAHLQAVGLFEQSEHPTEGTIRTMRHPARWLDTELPLPCPAPRLGEHSREVLREVGYEAAQIEALLAQRVIAELAGRGVTA